MQTFLKLFFRLAKKAAHNMGIGKKWAGRWSFSSTYNLASVINPGLTLENTHSSPIPEPLAATLLRPQPFDKFLFPVPSFNRT